MSLAADDADDHSVVTKHAKSVSVNDREAARFRAVRPAQHRPVGEDTVNVEEQHVQPGQTSDKFRRGRTQSLGHIISGTFFAVAS